MALSSLFVLGNFNMYQFMEEKTLFKDYQRIIHTKKQVTLIEIYQVGCSGSRSWIGLSDTEFIVGTFSETLAREGGKQDREEGEAGQGCGPCLTAGRGALQSIWLMFSHLEAEGARHHPKCWTYSTTPNRQHPYSHGAALLLGETRSMNIQCQEVTNIMRKQAGEARD